MHTLHFPPGGVRSLGRPDFRGDGECLLPIRKDSRATVCQIKRKKGENNGKEKSRFLKSAIAITVEKILPDSDTWVVFEAN